MKFQKKYHVTFRLIKWLWLLMLSGAFMLSNYAAVNLEICGIYFIAVYYFVGGLRTYKKKTNKFTYKS